MASINSILRTKVILDRNINFHHILWNIFIYIVVLITIINPK